MNAGIRYAQHRDPYLRQYCMPARANKRFDFRVLFGPLKQQFDRCLDLSRPAIVLSDNLTFLW